MFIGVWLCGGRKRRIINRIDVLREVVAIRELSLQMILICHFQGIKSIIVSRERNIIVLISWLKSHKI